MDPDSSATRMTSRIAGSTPGRPRPAGRGLLGLTAAAVILLAGCGHVGRLQNVGHTVSPAPADSTDREEGGRRRLRTPLRPLFGDTLIGLAPGTADSSIRFLGRLRDGYTADTLNIILCGDNRPGYRLSRLASGAPDDPAGALAESAQVLARPDHHSLCDREGAVSRLRAHPRDPRPHRAHAEVVTRAPGGERDDGEGRLAAGPRAERRGADQHRRSRV